jgi:hypothetical protein
MYINPLLVSAVVPGTSVRAGEPPFAFSGWRGAPRGLAVVVQA